MNNENQQNSIETFPIPEAGTPDSPILRATLEDSPPTTYETENSDSEHGHVIGRFDNPDGSRSDIVLNDSGSVVEVVDGMAKRSLFGDFIPGELLVAFNADDAIEGDWVAGETTTNEEGVNYTHIYKASDEGGLIEQNILTEVLRNYNQSEIPLPEFITSTPEVEQLDDSRKALAGQAIKSAFDLAA